AAVDRARMSSAGGDGGRGELGGRAGGERQRDDQHDRNQQKQGKKARRAAQSFNPGRALRSIRLTLPIIGSSLFIIFGTLDAFDYIRTSVRMAACLPIPRFALRAASPDRLDEPLALAPLPGGRQAVGEVSAAAEADGVEAGMPLGEALARCPSLR